MSNPAELELVRKAIASGLGGCVDWDINVIDRLRLELDRCGLTLERVKRELIAYVRNGGDVFQIKESRENWIDRRDYWYKVVLPMPDLFPNGLFVELTLVDDDPELPEIELINAHEQLS